MTPDRRIPETLGELVVSVLEVSEQQNENILALTTAVDHQARALAIRPTKRQTLRFFLRVVTVLIAANVVFLAAIWLSLRAGQRYIQGQVESGRAAQRSIVCAVLNDARSYHPGVAQSAPGCSTTTTTGP